MRLASTVFVAALALTTLRAGAAVVTVTPVQEIAPVGQVGLGETTLTDGWSIVTNALGWGKLSTYGPSTYNSRTGAFFFHRVYNPQDYDHPDQDFGRGAFYATCDWEKATAPRMMNDWTPSTVWLGTDKWQGQDVAGRKLGSITEMEYFSFVSKEPTKFGGSKTQQEWWAAASWMNGVSQPIQIQLVITDPSHTLVRQVWHRLWGAGYTGNDGGLSEPADDVGRWVVNYCLNTNHWYMPCSGTSPNELEYGLGNWSEAMSFTFPEGGYPPLREWELAATSTATFDEGGRKSPGYDAQLDGTEWKETVPRGSVNCTGTGKPINFFVGARIAEVRPRLDASGNEVHNTALFLQGVPIRWVNQSYGFRGQVDYFTLGFDGVSETYDFEPPAGDPPARVLASSERSLDVLRSPVMALWNQWNGNLYTVVGRVAAQPEGKFSQYFKIEDGSMLTYLDKGYKPDWINQVLPGPVRVYLPHDDFRGDPLWINTGQLVKVTGFIEPLRYVWSEIETARIPSSPLMIWTNINNVVRLD